MIYYYDDTMSDMDVVVVMVIVSAFFCLFYVNCIVFDLK